MNVAPMLVSSLPPFCLPFVLGFVVSSATHDLDSSRCSVQCALLWLVSFHLAGSVDLPQYMKLLSCFHLVVSFFEQLT